MEVDEIIKEIENSKVFVLSDVPGNGKSTEFKFLTLKLKENFKNRWILLIDLKMHTKNFEKNSENSTNFDSVDEISDFLAEKILQLKNFEKEIFSELFKNDRVVVLIRIVARGHHSGVALDRETAHIWSIADGRVTRCEVYFNRDEALAAAGL